MRTAFGLTAFACFALFLVIGMLICMASLVATGNLYYFLGGAALIWVAISIYQVQKDYKP
jgi:hypothetical protein